MHKARRYIIIILFFASVILLAIGFYLKNTGSTLVAHKCIGVSVALGFFIVMPLFIYHRWKDKNIKDYMLTEENILKMKTFNDSKK